MTLLLIRYAKIAFEYLSIGFIAASADDAVNAVNRNFFAEQREDESADGVWLSMRVLHFGGEIRSETALAALPARIKINVGTHKGREAVCDSQYVKVFKNYTIIDKAAYTAMVACFYEIDDSIKQSAIKDYKFRVYSPPLVFKKEGVWHVDYEGCSVPKQLTGYYAEVGSKTLYFELNQKVHDNLYTAQSVKRGKKSSRLIYVRAA